MMSFELFAVIALVILAIGDLIVGVINDAVNFLNSAIGAKVAKKAVILTVAAIGIIIGATFSDGIIEVARKGIFNPSFFETSEIIIIFSSVAIVDIILLDLYSTFGLPTSTTVSIVFELLGGALGMALIKTSNFTEAWQAINHDSALKIIVGIILSIGIAFTLGLISQFLTRLLFTFNYKKRMQKWGFLWSGVSLTILTYFVLIKGGKHSTFMTTDIKEWIQTNTLLLLTLSTIFFSILSLILIKLKVNILKVIILIGTGSLAMAFAGNDLANFIGVGIAGVNAFLGADLAGELPTPPWVLITAGVTMTIALFISKKANTVTKTTLNLSSHDKQGKSRWEKNILILEIISLTTTIFNLIKKLIPKFILNWINSRWDSHNIDKDSKQSFDLLRAAVNIIVATAVISYATSQKLPLSTTYVAFMVAMGASLGDGVWGKISGPSRLAGVITVISGWFATALIGVIATGTIVYILFYGQTYGLIALLIGIILLLLKLSKKHKSLLTQKT